MIKDICWVTSGDTLISYTTDKGEGTVPFSTIKTYWDYSNEDDFEGGRIYTLDDKTILLVLLGASDQTGAIVAWDTELDEIVHVSNGDYVVAVDDSEGFIYSLIFVHSFTTPGNFQLWKVPYGTKDQKDTCAVLERINEFEFSHADDYNGSFDDVDLTVTDGDIEIRLGDNVYKGMKN